MLLLNCEVTLDLNWSENCVICEEDRATTFAITNAKLYVPVVTLWTQDNAKLLQQLKSGFKRTINWNKYQSKTSSETQNQYLNFLISPDFQEVNSFFVLSFENRTDRTGHTRCYLPKVEIKDYNVKIDGRNFSDQPINDDITTYENIFKKMLLVKEIITQLVVYYSIIVLRKIIRWLQ